MKAKQILTTVASAIAMSLLGNVAQSDCPKAGERCIKNVYSPYLA